MKTFETTQANPPLASAQSPSPSTSPWVKLPAELFYQVANYLDLNSTKALSLTCKEAHSMLPFPRKSKFNNGPHALTELEADPNFGDHLIYCHDCKKLHVFEKGWSVENHSFGPQSYKPANPPVAQQKRHKNLRPLRQTRHRQNFPVERPTPACEAVTRNFGNGCLKVNYLHARAVMNRYLYGRRHGLPLSSLTATATSPSLRSAKLEQSMSGEIIDGELYIKSQHVLSWNSSKSADDIQAELANEHAFNYVGACKHKFLRSRAIGGGAWHPFWRHFPKLDSADVESEESGIVPCKKVRGRCNECATDYEYSIERKWDLESPKDYFWAITITCKTRLGDCREAWEKEENLSGIKFFLQARRLGDLIQDEA